MAGLFEFPHKPENFDNLPPLVPKGASLEERERILDEIAEAWSRPLPKQAEFSPHYKAAGVTLNHVALHDAERNEPIDFGELLHKVEGHLVNDRSDTLVISLRGCRIDKCQCHSTIITPRLQVFNCRFCDHANFASTTFAEGTNFIHTTFGKRPNFTHTVFGKNADFGDTVFGNRAAFGGAQFGDRANFRKTNFGESAHFWGATFGEGVTFGEATFSNMVNFGGVVFGKKVYFGCASFGEQANFENAKFGNQAKFYAARFGEGLNFYLVHFGEGASFHSTFFDRPRLSNANFDRADLRNARGVLLDETRIFQAQMEGDAPDPWSQLRRAYTGPWFFIHLILLTLFFAPFISHALSLSAAAQLQSQLLAAPMLMNERSTVRGGDSDNLTREMIKAARQLSSEVQDRYIMNRQAMPAILVLLGWHRGWWAVVLSSVVILYNMLRSLLTLQVGRLRDAEERSGVSPRLDEYHGLTHPLNTDYGTTLFAALRLWYSEHRSSRIRILVVFGRRFGANHGINAPPSLLKCIGYYRVHLFAKWVFIFSLCTTIYNLLLWAVETWVWVSPL